MSNGATSAGAGSSTPGAPMPPAARAPTILRSFTIALIASVVLAGCAMPAPETNPTPSQTPTVPPTSSSPWVPWLSSFAPQFDGERALELVREQVHYPNGSVRTRVPGTPGNDEVAAWIAGKMEAAGFAARYHHFNASYGCEQVAMHNVVAERPGTSGRTVVFAAHYDTRPVADKDADPAARDEPIAGANDGGSGVAVLIELARVLSTSEDEVQFLFFDGEDGGGYGSPRCDTGWILGSRAFAANMTEPEVAAVDAFILVDMVGDPQLRLPREVYSARGPGAALMNEIYSVAARHGHTQFLNESGLGITDDHIPFIERGIPAIDLIHTTTDGRAFPDWHHTHDDDMDAVSAESLDAVGETLEAWFALRSR